MAPQLGVVHRITHRWKTSRPLDPVRAQRQIRNTAQKMQSGRLFLPLQTTNGHPQRSPNSLRNPVRHSESRETKKPAPSPSRHESMRPANCIVQLPLRLQPLPLQAIAAPKPLASWRREPFLLLSITQTCQAVLSPLREQKRARVSADSRVVCMGQKGCAYPKGIVRIENLKRQGKTAGPPKTADFKSP